MLKFNIKATLAASTVVAAFESGGYHSVFSRLRLFHGSNLLEDIQNYNELAKHLYDFQMPLDAIQGRYSVTSGTTNEYVGVADASGVVAARPVNRGRNEAIGSPAGVSGAKTYSACINLISLVGSLAGGKYLPLFEATSAPLRVELVIVPALINAMCISPTVNSAFTIENVEYIAEFLELPDSAVAAVKAGSSSPMQMVTPSYRAYTFSQSVTGGASTQLAMPIPAKFSSLKHILVNQKNQVPALSTYPVGSFALGLSQYQFRIGSEVLPSNPPTTAAEFFTEAAKCFGSIADVDYQPAVDVNNYALDPSGATVTTYSAGMTTNSGSFLVGIDCEPYQNADKSTIFNGMNTNTSDIYFLPQYSVPAGVSNIYLGTAFVTA